ncbi:MAG TPA: hypothetical protein VGR14_10325 [Verrucomicrobiae bacterium]|jgi:hypothetical protein|nr:hypothetical protein [Verrucomicrobiae bacterium]
MSTVEIILSQVAISLVVVTLYHLWVASKKQTAPTVSALPAPPVPSVATPASAAATPPPAKTPAATEQISPEILAVIAAAIEVVLGQPHRVVSVQPAAAPMPVLSVWALEGRMDQFKSHKVR